MIKNNPSELELESTIEFNSLLSRIILLVYHKININPQERTNIMNVGSGFYTISIYREIAQRLICKNCKLLIPKCTGIYFFVLQ